MPTPEPLPRQLLSDQRFAAACAARQIGIVFRLAKTRAGLYPAQIARRTGLTTSRVTEYMSGDRVVSSMDVIERIADGLGIPGGMLGLAPRSWEDAPSPTGYQPTPAPETWEILDMLTRSTASDATLMHLEAAVSDLAFRYPTLGPAQSLPVMSRQLAAVHELLNRPQALSARRRCVQILTILSGLLGLAYMDVGDWGRSDAFFHMGVVAAGEVEDGGLTAWLLTMQSIAASSAGRTVQAAGLLGQAESLAGGAPARRRAWIRANRGRVLAMQGDERPALLALEQSAVDLASAEEVGGLDFFSSARLEGIVGASQAALGRFDEAERLLTGALERRDPADAKGLAMITYDLADCRVRQGDFDEACLLSHRALDVAGDSMTQPIVSRARAFQRALQAWRPDGPVGELAARVRESELQLGHG